MSQSINIVKLIEENPSTKLSRPYQGKLLNKLKESFSTEEQQLFISSFYCYLNFKSDDFVIDFDDIWNWLGFTRKDNAKRCLEKFFKPDEHYKIISLISEENTKTGRPSEKIMLNIKTFKKMCLKANTSKANEIHEYYIKLEETLHELIDEESNELRMQIQMKEEEIKRISEQKESEIQRIEDESESKLFENNEENRLKICEALMESYDNKNVVYLGYIGQINGLDSWKFGNSAKLLNRIRRGHRKTYERFELVLCIECNQQVKLEEALKNSEKAQKYIFSHPFRVEGSKEFTNVTELIRFDKKFTIEKFKKLLMKLKNSIEMVDELRIQMEKTEHLKLEIEIKNIEEETKRLIKQEEEETKRRAKDHPSDIREISEEQELTQQVESERQINQEIQENNNRIADEIIDNHVIDLVDINIFENIYFPIQVTYKGKNTFLYVAEVNSKLYINLNSMSIPKYPMERWKRGAEIQRQILKYNIELEKDKMCSIYSHKSKGTWVLFDFFCKDYFNWYGALQKKINNSTDYSSFGTFLEVQLPKLIKEYDISKDRHFIHISRGDEKFKVRANRENNYINLTDIFKANKKDIRKFNDKKEYKNYISENSEDHYINGNNIVDEFGMKVSWGHPKLALLVINHLYKENTDEKTNLIDFALYFMDKVE